MKYLLIREDTNDADYIESLEKITEKQIKKFKPLIVEMKNYKHGHNWPCSEYDTQGPKDIYKNTDPDIIEEFQEFVPFGEYGVHTIESIHIYDVKSIENLL